MDLTRKNIEIYEWRSKLANAVQMRREDSSCQDRYVMFRMGITLYAALILTALVIVPTLVRL